MTESLEQSNPNTVSLSSLGWGQGFVCFVCQNCDWRFLVDTGNIPQECPHCHAQIHVRRKVCDCGYSFEVP